MCRYAPPQKVAQSHRGVWGEQNEKYLWGTFLRSESFLEGSSIHSYLSGTFRTCQLSGFWHFSALSTTFASVCKHVVTWGGGGYVYTF